MKIGCRMKLCGNLVSILMLYVGLNL